MNTIKNIAFQNSTKSIRSAIFDSSKYNEGRYIIKFTFPKIHAHKFSEGDSVIVSNDDGKKIAILLGFVVGTVGEDFLCISSEKPIITCYQSTKLRIDLNGSMKILITNTSTLANLMNPSDISKKLRNLIIHGNPPIFDSKISKSTIEKIKHIIRTCNSDQRRAIKCSLFAKDYALIKGYPGSGKTSCIIAMIRIFVLMGMRILVSSYTHSAVTNILQKLDRTEINYLYINGNHQVPDKLQNGTLDSILSSNKIENLADFKGILEKLNVIGVTCLSANNAVLSHMTFDVVIIDEAGQITLPISIIPLLKVNPDGGKFILVGDLLQLPPLVRNYTARIKGLDQSLLSKLCSFDYSKSVSELKIQYRMNSEILKLCNNITYNNLIICATEEVASATIPQKISVDNLEFWKQQCCSGDLKRSVIFLDYKKLSECDEVYFNNFEARIAIDLVQQFLKLGIYESDIGIIIPYNQQKDLLNNMCNSRIEINTVDQYQGRDKSVIIMSFVRHDKSNQMNVKESLDILTDNRRLNVALSRAKHKLIMIGNLDYLSSVYEPVRKLKGVIRNDQIISI